jgi:hypothetical protein
MQEFEATKLSSATKETLYTSANYLYSSSESAFCNRMNKMVCDKQWNAVFMLSSKWHSAYSQAHFFVRSEILTAVVIRLQVLRDLRAFISVNTHFGGICRLQLLRRTENTKYGAVSYFVKWKPLRPNISNHVPKNINFILNKKFPIFLTFLHTSIKTLQLKWVTLCTKLLWELKAMISEWRMLYSNNVSVYSPVIMLLGQFMWGWYCSSE